MKIENYYNPTEAAKFLGTSRPTFYNIIKRHDLKPIARMGNMNLFDLNDLKKVKVELAKAQQ